MFNTKNGKFKIAELSNGTELFINTDNSDGNFNNLVCKHETLQPTVETRENQTSTVLCIGIKGSGKSKYVAHFMEEFRREFGRKSKIILFTMLREDDDDPAFKSIKDIVKVSIDDDFDVESEELFSKGDKGERVNKIGRAHV